MQDKVDASQEQAPRIKPPEPGAPWNEVEQVIYRRRSIRFFQKKQVPEHLVRRVLEAGRFAPSAGNAQPWKFIVVQDQNMIAEMTRDIVDLCRRLMKMVDYLEPGKSWRSFPARLFQRLRTNEFHPIPFGAMKLIAEGKLGVWHGAPTVIVILTDSRSPGAPLLDVGIAGQNMVLTAHSMGLGTCWVSFVKPLSYLPKWKKRLGISYPYKLASSIALGYPRGNPDGQVNRETQAIDWYTEDGTVKSVY